MKNVLSAIFALLILIFASSCVAEKIMPLEETASLTNTVDTIITFDPETFEETIHLVIAPDKPTQEFSDYTYQIDTIITFDVDTYEETVKIVKTKVPVKKN